MSSTSENNEVDGAASLPIGASSSEGVVIVVMGVSGSGKTTLGAALAKALSLPFIDADDLHSEANKAKMARSEPLTDADRAPWLVCVRRAAVKAVECNARGVVVACSALKATYRQVLRGERANLNPDAHSRGDACGEATVTAPRTVFVHPYGARAVLMERMTSRKSHFMKVEMVASQMEILENPCLTGESGIIEIRLEASVEEQVRAAVEGLALAVR
ncbi:P-loop containing nucleoside triphosphate hydrolase protein [Russula aff. rugulosa BPL654]|nr:P-loop containing nucleoside triphosphate hydrolase protein [Russula aff. rugulosa BPL654]